MGSIKQNLANNILSGGKFDATDLDGTIPNTNINDNSIDNVTSFPAAGSGIPSVASDPPSPSAGDVWYNTTSNAFKYLGLTTVGAWATGGNMNTSRSDLAGAGTQASALVIAGYPNRSIVESYDGSSWTEVADLNTARESSAGFGQSNTAAITAGGRNPGNLSATESWNGSSWTEVNDLNTARFSFNISGAGTQTSGLVTGAYPPSSLTESWNGTSWTEVADLNTARTQGSMTGSSNTNAIVTAGSPGDIANAETWNGTSWTEVGDLNTGRYSSAMSGTSTAALLFAGRNPSGGIGNTESWNGSAWTEDTDLSSARFDLAAGNYAASTAALAFAGKNPPTTFFNATEEWTGAGSPVTKTVTTA
jgi:hypothetical protein